MTYEQPSSLAFSIKESVWLNQGEEIDELLSLALEPDISIREADDQVFIKGSLLLFGEYRPKDHDDSARSFSDQVGFRSVEEVTMSDDGIGMIRHSFPLDVTIPREKINRLEDIYVTVDAFDYELPSRGCIELEANVSVSGIRNERTIEPEDAYEEQEKETQHDFYTPAQEYHEQTNHFETEQREERSFHFEAVREAAADDERQDNDFDPVAEVMNENNPIHEENQRSAAFEQRFEPEEPEQQEVEENHFEETQRYGDYDEHEEETGESYHTEPDLEPVSEYEPELVRSEPTVTFSAQPKETNVVADSGDYDAVTDNGRDSTETESSSGKDENALYLTKMLTKGEEEFSKLRMCIVQDGESLETIAERYNIQVSNLIRMNRLNEERVAEGQILYIPVKKSPTSSS